MIREATGGDLLGLLQLYKHLHENPMPNDMTRAAAVWQRMLDDADHHVILAEEAGEIVSSCILLIVPNLTRGQRPYGLIENVVTHPEHRCRGHASACLGFAKTLADRADCYKIMLLTSSKQESTLRFYERAGFDSGEKTAFIRRKPE